MGFAYDKASNLESMTDARGLVTRYSCDAMRRIRTKKYSNTTRAVDVEHIYGAAALPQGVTAPPPIFTRANTLRRLYAAITYASSGLEPLAELTASFYSAHEGIGENKSFRRRPKAKN